MLSTLPSAPDHLSDTQPAEPFDTVQRLTLAGYPPEAIAFLGISRLHGIGFQTMGRLGGRDAIRNILKAADIRVLKEMHGGKCGRQCAAVMTRRSRLAATTKPRPAPTLTTACIHSA
jgi:hypothetical protein